MRFSSRQRRVAVRLLAAIYLSLVLYAVFNYCSRCQVTLPEATWNQYRVDHSDLGKCFIDWHSLGTTRINIFNELDITLVEEKHAHIHVGGSWKPSNCKAWQKVAVIIPYRNRWRHLKMIVNRLHSMLMKQKLDYRIFVIQQAGVGTFNRGKLNNIGYLEALRHDKYDCFVFHDVDLIPENDKNMYTCDMHARHLSSAIDELRYHVPYYSSFGGVIAINRENMKKVNGYSNSYWGWGNEDDDLSARTEAAGLLLTRPPEYIGRYKMAKHIKDSRSKNGYDLFLTWRGRWATDGLNDTRGMMYSAVARTNHKLYTNITVDVGTYRPQPKSDLEKVTLWWFLKFYFP